MLPDGAWLVAALDLELDSPAQREREAKARRDPSQVRNPKGGCQFPSTHFALAMYGDKDVVVASRGGYHRAALLDCVAGMAAERAVHRTSIGGLPTIELRSPEGVFALTATDQGMVVGASSVPLLSRTVDARGNAMTDPQLATLVRDARSRGELWIAARVPRRSAAIASVLKLLSIDTGHRVTAIVGSVRLQAPFRIAVALEVDGGAAAMATALDLRRRAFGKLLDADLAPILDALRVTADGNTVRIVGEPANLDIWKVFQGVLRTIANA